MRGSLEGLRSAPWDSLPLSAAVDFLHLFACDKPAVRTRFLRPSNISAISNWCANHGLSIAADSGYVVVAWEQSTADLVLALDQSPYPHEQELGRLLGYPVCCCDFIARAGEEQINLVEVEIGQATFAGRFRLINPKGYAEGRAFICHLPCSPTCMPSLKIAQRALAFIRAYPADPALARWQEWLREYGYCCDAGTRNI